MKLPLTDRLLVVWVSGGSWDGIGCRPAGYHGCGGTGVQRGPLSVHQQSVGNHTPVRALLDTRAYAIMAFWGHSVKGQEMSEHYTVTGTLSNGRTVVLDQPVPLPSGRVRVTVVTLPGTGSKTTFLAKLEAIHQTLRASGYRSRTREQVDAQIQAERESWGP